MALPLVTIIIPCYNAAPYLAETLASVVAQTYSNWECLIVDDGSTDESWQLIKEHEAKLPTKIKAHPNKGKGACKARNLGISLAKGKYIQFLDADDTLTPNKLLIQVEALEKTNGDSLATCHWQYISSSSNHHSSQTHPSICKTLSNKDWLLQRKTMYPHAFLSPTKIIQATKGWDESLYINQDGEFFYRVMLHCKQVIFCENTKVNYRLHSANSLSKRPRDEKYYNSSLKAAYSYQKCIHKLANESEALKPIANYFKDIAFLAYGENKAAYIEAISHPSIKYANSQYSPEGHLMQSIEKVFGWKFVKGITVSYYNLKRWLYLTLNR